MKSIGSKSQMKEGSDSPTPLNFEKQKKEIILLSKKI